MSKYKRNILILLTGTLFAQILPILVSPILTRLFSPEEFGNLAIFMSTVLIISSIATLRYDLSIVLPDNEEDALTLVSIGVINTTIISLITFFVMVFLLLNSNNFFDELGLYLILIPVMVFFLGIFNCLNYYNTRHQNFTLLAKVKVVKGFTIALTQVIVGFLIPISNGLIVGEIMGSIASNTRLLNESLSISKMKKNFSMRKALTLMKKYKDFPIYSMPANLTSVVNTHSINYFIKFIYSTEILGFYSLVMRILSSPSGIIGQSIGQVFYQQAANDRNKLGNSQKIYLKTLLTLSLIGLSMGVFLYFTIDYIILFLYGENWMMAADIGKVILPLIVIKFITVPLSTINSIYEKQNISLIWQLSNLILICSVFIMGSFFSLDFIDTLKFYNWVIFLNYFILIIITYKISRG